MSSSSSPSLVLELHRASSRYLPAVLLLVVSLTLPWLAGSWSLIIRLLCVTLGSSFAIASLWRLGLFSPARQLSRLSWDQDQCWRLQFGSTEPVTAQLLGRSWCAPWAMCLKFKTDAGRRCQVLLWRGQLSRQAWQQWLLRLRQEGGRQMEQVVPGADNNLNTNLKIGIIP